MVAQESTLLQRQAEQRMLGHLVLQAKLQPAPLQSSSRKQRGQQRAITSNVLAAARFIGTSDCASSAQRFSESCAAAKQTRVIRQVRESCVHARLMECARYWTHLTHDDLWVAKGLPAETAHGRIRVNSHAVRAVLITDV